MARLKQLLRGQIPEIGVTLPPYANFCSEQRRLGDYFDESHYEQAQLLEACPLKYDLAAQFRSPCFCACHLSTVPQTRPRLVQELRSAAPPAKATMLGHAVRIATASTEKACGTHAAATTWE